MTLCPLPVPHATATVTATGQGFAVDITSDDAGSVQEIINAPGSWSGRAHRHEVSDLSR
jgi:hypothetical protein